MVSGIRPCHISPSLSLVSSLHGRAKTKTLRTNSSSPHSIPKELSRAPSPGLELRLTKIFVPDPYPRTHRAATTFPKE